MKASRYVKAFEKDVDYWEWTLSHILEVIEMVLQVQRQWMYLDVRMFSFTSTQYVERENYGGQFLWIGFKNSAL